MKKRKLQLNRASFFSLTYKRQREAFDLAQQESAAPQKDVKSY